MVLLDHCLLGYVSFGLFTLTMFSGAMIFLSKERKELWIKFHVVSSLVAYIMAFIAVWIVR